MKRALGFLSIALGMIMITPVSGQQCTIYDGYDEGTTTKMVHYDKKDKETGTTTTTVKERVETADGMALKFHQVYDNDDDYTFESEFNVECKNGEIKVDMSKLLDPNTMTAYEEMEYNIEADELSIPPDAKPGDKLNDGAITVTVETGSPITVSISVEISNRKVESKETLETPAGTFDCIKITYDMLTSIGFVKVRASAVEYFNKKHGVVRSESYNKKGKLAGYSVLEEIKN